MDTIYYKNIPLLLIFFNVVNMKNTSSTIVVQQATLQHMHNAVTTQL